MQAPAAAVSGLCALAVAAVAFPGTCTAGSLLGAARSAHTRLPASQLRHRCSNAVWHACIPLRGVRQLFHGGAAAASAASERH